jgi:hypothetical protein
MNIPKVGSILRFMLMFVIMVLIVKFLVPENIKAAWLRI